MRDTSRLLWRVALCLIVFVIAGTVTALICESGRVRVLLPNEVTEAQLQVAIKEARTALREAGRSQEEIDKMVFEFRCKYLPASTEGCSDDQSSHIEKQR